MDHNKSMPESRKEVLYLPLKPLDVWYFEMQPWMDSYLKISLVMKTKDASSLPAQNEYVAHVAPFDMLV